MRLEHPDVGGLYPCVEGTGFVGGIVSAAIGGQKCAEELSPKNRNYCNLG